jgi:hypothetical protein
MMLTSIFWKKCINKKNPIRWGIELLSSLILSLHYSTAPLTLLLKMQLFYYLKDIVQPKKRGVKRGTIPTVMTSHTIADVF